MAANIHQEVSFNASPGLIYEALIDGAQFTALSGAPAEIDGTAGGAFTMFGGMITGRTIEIVENRRLVQAWRVANWPEGVYSIVRFELAAAGDGTKMTLDQTGFPAEAAEQLEAGWSQMYWGPLQKYLA